MLAGMAVGFFPQKIFFENILLLLLPFIVIYCKKKIKILTLWLVRGLEGLSAALSCNSYTPPPQKSFILF